MTQIREMLFLPEEAPHATRGTFSRGTFSRKVRGCSFGEGRALSQHHLSLRRDWEGSDDPQSYFPSRIM